MGQAASFLFQDQEQDKSPFLPSLLKMLYI